MHTAEVQKNGCFSINFIQFCYTHNFVESKTSYVYLIEIHCANSIFNLYPYSRMLIRIYWLIWNICFIQNEEIILILVAIYIEWCSIRWNVLLKKTSMWNQTIVTLICGFIEIYCTFTYKISSDLKFTIQNQNQNMEHFTECHFVHSFILSFESMNSKMFDLNFKR